ncbi:hypothetical protein [Roseateles flavus]|uniref:Uncharacterized protein n=1 Tax=Roseateles flavus TaxID=3149041 RepID=A0ABV0GGF7_9BURK
MSDQTSISVRVELTCIGTATLYRPDRLDLSFDAPLLVTISQALSALSALNQFGASVMLPLRDLDSYFRQGRPWQVRDISEGRFAAACAWLHVEPERFHVEVWEACGDDELHGLVELSEAPRLQQALQARQSMARQELLLLLQRSSARVSQQARLPTDPQEARTPAPQTLRMPALDATRSETQP